MPPLEWYPCVVYHCSLTLQPPPLHLWLQEELHARFFPGLPKRVVVSRVHGLIDRSLGNWRTRMYDKFQRVVQGIL